MIDRKQKGTATGRDQGKTHPPKHASSDPHSPARPHLPQFRQLLIVYSHFESICELSHRFGQSPCDLVSGNAVVDTPRAVLS
jgi:hypothetical protein